MAGFAPRRLALPKGDRVLCHRWLPFGGLSRGAAGRLRKAGVLVFSLCSGYMHSGSNLTFLCLLTYWKRRYAVRAWAVLQNGGRNTRKKTQRTSFGKFYTVGSNSLTLAFT